VTRDDAAPLLGTMPDSKLAEQAGVSAATIANWRRALGVPAFSRNAGLAVTGTRSFLRALGTDEDAAIGRRFGVSREVVKHHRTRLELPSFRELRAALISKLLDEGMGIRAVAREVGVSPAAVRKHRDTK
jgi:predicted methyltransferase MtxX (methanogen marker protein 4)